ncbi:uncharacterized protein LOC131165093 [Malania oleifera]|uniref:uncharacterized protein LOC131165093 n=1 Tax=Malania oleifera TaxID=397392 RepID=UPI0025ADCEAA|nr:uncharacterized protein LOC131165093 [Malania oleifera]
MDPGNSSVRASSDDGVGPSGKGGGDSNVVLRCVAQQVMAEIVRSSKEQGGPLTDQGCTIEKFTKMNPPAFSKGADPAIAEKLVDKGGQKMVEGYMLLEEQRRVPMAMTCSRFKEIFFDHYFPTIVRDAKVAKIIKLTQRNLTVQKYATKFIELSCFAPYVIPNEVKKVRMFERGLRQDIYKQVVVLKVYDFSKLVDRATVVEESSQRDTGTPSQRKRPTPLGFQAWSSQGPWRGDRYGRAQR